jgi:asparagine synthase (glutamine-hydrolysing)
MCGIVGFWTKNADQIRRRELLVREMADRVRHRGPDDAGIWLGEDREPAFGHRRLSIIDLSEAGRQPMVSSDGRIVITYNGEVYNYQQMRSALLEERRVEFRGESDTEVLVEAIAHWGLRETVERANGMFAFAVWNRHEERLSLVRDRIGIKPLYWGRSSDGVYFGSELDTIAGHPGFEDEIDPQGLGLLLRYNRIPAPRSIYEDVRKVSPGAIVEFEAPDKVARESRFWSAGGAVRRGRERPFRGTAEEAVDVLEEKLAASVEARMVSDVPLGAFLSGGIDSSTVVALMQAVSDEDVRTFSIGFESAAYDEASDAAAVAEYLGCDHTELYVSPEDAREVIPELPEMYDEPFADSSQIPTHLVSRLARRDVTVALSGDGGDELYGGYNRHLWGPRVWSLMRWMPESVRHGAAAAGRALSRETWNGLGRVADRVVPGGTGIRRPGEKIHKLAGVLPSRDAAELYDRLDGQWERPEALVRGLSVTPHPSREQLVAEEEDFASQMMYADLVGYLPDDILTKVDRASMAVSLEVRVPMVDHRLVEFAWRLPMDVKIRQGTGKWVLRQVLYRHVPRELVDRPKTGFGFPVGEWLRGPLREWGEALLDERRLREQGYLDAGRLREAWERHLSEHVDLAHELWSVLMFQAWLEKRGG